MKLLFANATHRWGGVKSWTLAVGGGLAARGHAVEIALRPADTFGEAAGAAGLHVHRVRYGPDWNPLAIAGLAARLGAGRHDLVITNVGKDNRTAGVAARLAGVPVVHRVGGPGDLTDRWAVRFAARRLVTAILVPSVSTRAAVQALPWGPGLKVEVIPSGVDLERFRPGPGGGVLRSAIGADPGDFLVVSTGQLTALKGQRFLVEAAARLIAGGVPVRLVLIGRGPEAEALGNLASSLGIGHRVALPGFRRDIPDLLEDADVAVQPSLVEGLPHSVLEFLAKGKALVATRLPGIAEAVDDGKNGLLVPPGDPEALAGALARLHRDPALRAALGRAARARAEAEFGVDRMLDRVETFFQEIAGARRR